MTGLLSAWVPIAQMTVHAPWVSFRVLAPPGRLASWASAGRARPKTANVVSGPIARRAMPPLLEADIEGCPGAVIGKPRAKLTGVGEAERGAVAHVQGERGVEVLLRQAAGHPRCVTPDRMGGECAAATVELEVSEIFA